VEIIVLKPTKVFRNDEGYIYSQFPDGADENEFYEEELSLQDVINIFLETELDIDIINIEYAISKDEESNINQESAIIFYEKKPWKVIPWNLY